MTVKSQRPKGRDGILSSLNMAIDALNLAKEVSSITPAKAVFGTVAILLTTIRVSLLFFCDEKFRISHKVRTQWSMNKVMLSSGYSALISVELLNGE